MEFRGDIIHYNEAIIDPAELALAKTRGLSQRDVFNRFFRNIVLAYRTGAHSRAGRKLTIEEVRDILIEALPAMKDEWNMLEHIDVWSDGLQMWFREGGSMRDICLRPSGTDAKSKVYFDGHDKEFLRQIYCRNFENFTPSAKPRYSELIKEEE